MQNELPLFAVLEASPQHSVPLWGGLILGLHIEDEARAPVDPREFPIDTRRHTSFYVRSKWRNYVAGAPFPTAR